MSPSPTSAVAGSTGEHVTLDVHRRGRRRHGLRAACASHVPAGWSAPSTTGTAAGYTTASTGTVGVAGQVVTVTGVTLAGSATMTITYGSTAGGGPGATAPTSTGAGSTWQAEQRSSAAGTFTNLGASPAVTITPGPLNNFLVEAAGGGAIGTQTVGVPFSIRVTARDVNANTVTSFNGAGNTVDVSSSGTLTAGNGTTATFTNGVLASHSVTLGSTGSVTVTATRTSGGSQSGTSASFTSNPGTLANVSPVAITGTAKVGQMLSRSSASWNPGPDSRAYQWRRCNAAGAACADISGATSTDYTLVAADLGQTIRVVETASKTAYNDATSTSAQTAVVVAGDFTNVSPVSITGTAKVGQMLSRSSASWNPGPDSRAYQWRRCNAAGGACADISGETSTDYTLVPADLGQTIRVVETATKTAYNDATSTSSQTAVVALGDMTNASPVAITGTAKVGQLLTRSAAGWNPGPDSPRLPVAPLQRSRRELRRHRRRDRQHLRARRLRPRPDDPGRRDCKQDGVQRRDVDLGADRRRRARRPRQHLARLDHRHRQGRPAPHPLRRRLEPGPRLARLPVAPLRLRRRELRRHRRRDRQHLRARSRRPRLDDPGRRDGLQDRRTTTPPPPRARRRSWRSAT